MADRVPSPSRARPQCQSTAALRVPTKVWGLGGSFHAMFVGSSGAWAWVVSCGSLPDFVTGREEG